MEIKLEDFKTAYPDLHKEIITGEMKEGFESGLEEGKAQGFTAGAESESEPD